MTDASAKSFHPKVVSLIPHYVSVLDAGVEVGALGALIRLYCRPKRLVGVDIYQPYLDQARRYGFYDELRRCDFREPLPFADREFDVAVCCEVVEHLRREEGVQLIQELKRIAKMVIITTPNGYHMQGELDANPFQKHLSGWYVRDLQRMGFKVRGVGCLQVYGHEFHKPVDISFFLTSLTYSLPRVSSHLLAVYGSKLRTVEMEGGISS